MVRIFREVDDVQPSSPTGKDMPLGLSPPGDVPGEKGFDQYQIEAIKKVVREEFRRREAEEEEEEEKTLEAIKRRIEALEEKVRADEGAGETRGETPGLPAGPEQPRTFPERRKTIVTGNPASVKDSLGDIQGRVKEFVRKTGGLM
jgi:hypothetical protein